MPIRRQHRWLYPIDWRELSATIRIRRAKGRCEHCGRPHLETVKHLGDGRWWDEVRRTWRDGRGHRVAGLPASDKAMPFPRRHGPRRRGQCVSVDRAARHVTRR